MLTANNLCTDRLQKLYDLKVQQIKKSKTSPNSIRDLVMLAEAEAISQQIKICSRI
jgi:hypothetical protein